MRRKQSVPQFGCVLLELLSVFAVQSDILDCCCTLSFIVGFFGTRPLTNVSVLCVSYHGFTLFWSILVTGRRAETLDCLASLPVFKTRGQRLEEQIWSYKVAYFDHL